jgi:hypothetical protein|uniref:Uncharacterized protein n=1 Tax=viral metagenome TaxID=1070528 RepID=A0A6C0IK51_9ZZZZ
MGAKNKKLIMNRLQIIPIINIDIIMERRLNKKFEGYITEFKHSILEKSRDLEFSDKDKVSDLLRHIYDYDRLQFDKEDLNKRKRVKNTVPVTNRCNAKRANGEQCTRRRKNESEYCGTHVKGTPHGLISDVLADSNDLIVKYEVYAKEISGIVYYIDDIGNVYNTEDVLMNAENPRVVAKYVKQNNLYTIPDFNLP